MSIFSLLPFLLFDESGGGGGDEDWRTDLPEGIQEWDEVKNSDTPEKFWEQMTNMKSFLGQSIRIPSEEAGEEDISAFHQKLQAKVPGLMPVPNTDDPTAIDAVLAKLGKPGEAKDYAIPEIDARGQNVDLSVYEGLKPIAHKHGLSKKQFEGVIKDFAELQLDGVVKLNDTAVSEREGLFKTWGATKDSKLQAIVALTEKTKAPAEIVSLIAKGRLDAPSLEWLDRIATQFGGSEGVNLLDDKGDGGREIMTPAEAQGLIDDIMNNKQHAYWVAGHPGHGAAMKRMIQLQALAHPDASTDPNALRSSQVGVQPDAG